MASTNKTTNYELSQYVGSDKPTYLGDYNGDMLKIDTQMKLNATAASTADSKATTAGTNAATALENAATADSKAVTAGETATSALSKATSNETKITALENANNYSDTEDIPCGTWIDGKIIYKRTVTYNTLATSYSIDKIGTNGFGTFIKAEALMHRKDYPIYEIVPSRTNEAYAVEFKSGGYGASTQGLGANSIVLEFIYGNSITSSTFENMVITYYFTKFNEPA